MKETPRQVESIYSASVTVGMFLLLIASQTYGSNCQSTLAMSAETWTGLGEVGKTDWCAQWSNNAPLEKPGVPCICMGASFGFALESGVDLSSCNPLLDPASYDAAEAAGKGGWCLQWAAREENVFTWLIQGDEPCECLWFFERFQWRLLALLGTVILGTSAAGILYIWILITPIWFEVGIYGVDNRNREHIAAARIGLSHRVSLPLLVLERKLGRQLGGDRHRFKSIAKVLYPGAEEETNQVGGIGVRREGTVTIHEEAAAKQCAGGKCCHCKDREDEDDEILTISKVLTEKPSAAAADGPQTPRRTNNTLRTSAGQPMSPSDLVNKHKKREDELARWVFRPLCYRCVKGVREELVLHRDFVHLHA